MKIIEVTTGVLLPLTNEEADLLLKFKDGNSVSRKELNERQVEVANHLVVKDILLRINQNGRINYSKKAP